MNDPTVMKIAQFHNKTSAQVLLRWAIEHGMSKYLLSFFHVLLK